MSKGQAQPFIDYKSLRGIIYSLEGFFLPMQFLDFRLPLFVRLAAASNHPPCLRLDSKRNRACPVVSRGTVTSNLDPISQEAR